jgi:threonine dehydratase
VEVAGRTLWLKLEHLQVTGSFKARGATNTLLQLHHRDGPVVAISGGNHGLGVAYAAGVVGAFATVVVPDTVPDEKARRLSALGATVVRHGAEFADTVAFGEELAEQLAAPLVHPFADPAVICGQGTVGLELPDACDAVIVAVGGGGLIAGIATAVAPEGRMVVGVEPEGIPTLHDALAAGRPVPVPVRSITASALGAPSTAPINLAIAQRAVDRVELVADADILAARDLLWQTCRLAVEPAAACGVAAVIDGLVDDADEPCVVLCGANTAWVPVD